MILVRSVTLEELPGVPERVRRARMRIDANALHVLVEPEVTVPIAVLEGLGRVSARKRSPAF